MEEIKKFVITAGTIAQIIDCLKNRNTLLLRDLLKELPEFTDQEEIIKQLKKEIGEKEEEINTLLDKLLKEKDVKM